MREAEFLLPADLAREVADELAAWADQGKAEALWRGDSDLWTGSGEERWLGWLHATRDRSERGKALARWAEEVRGAGLTDAVVLGMGGSSLCPEVLARTFPPAAGFPRLHVLDSTDPAQVAACERQVDPDRTWFVVASKSGTTLEPNVFKAYFYDRLRGRLGAREAGRRFVAITDPGSQLEAVAREEGFRRIFHGEPSIGGRFSALSDFGMVPAATAGIDVGRFLERAHAMVEACGPGVAPADNPGVRLGAVLGVLASRGADKLTLAASPGIAGLGAWLEQLIAESTGKRGKAIIPVDGEPLGPPEAYGADRLFAYLRLESAADRGQDEAIERLAAAGRPVVRIPVAEPYDLGGEFFRWEVATAVAGAVLGINPFDQPDVEASKVQTRRLTERFEETGALPAEQPFLERQGLGLFSDPVNARRIQEAAGSEAGLGGCLRAHLAALAPGDYLALLAYLPMTGENDAPLQAIRRAVRDRTGNATCLGYGPRFLHSTGQAYKGGPDSGVFLQITADPEDDLAIPGGSLTFGVVQAAQARGDFQVLIDRGRRALRVHLGADIAAGLERLRRELG